MVRETTNNGIFENFANQRNQFFPKKLNEKEQCKELTSLSTVGDLFY